MKCTLLSNKRTETFQNEKKKKKNKNTTFRAKKKNSQQLQSKPSNILHYTISYTNYNKPTEETNNTLNKRKRHRNQKVQPGREFIFNHQTELKSWKKKISGSRSQSSQCKTETAKPQLTNIKMQFKNTQKNINLQIIGKIWRKTWNQAKPRSQKRSCSRKRREKKGKNKEVEKKKKKKENRKNLKGGGGYALLFVK